MTDGKFFYCITRQAHVDEPIANSEPGGVGSTLLRQATLELLEGELGGETSVVEFPVEYDLPVMKRNK